MDHHVVIIVCRLVEQESMCKLINQKVGISEFVPYPYNITIILELVELIANK